MNRPIITVAGGRGPRRWVHLDRQREAALREQAEKLGVGVRAADGTVGSGWRALLYALADGKLVVVPPVKPCRACPGEIES